MFLEKKKNEEKKLKLDFIDISGYPFVAIETRMSYVGNSLDIYVSGLRLFFFQDSTFRMFFRREELGPALTTFVAVKGQFASTDANDNPPKKLRLTGETIITEQITTLFATQTVREEQVSVDFEVDCGEFTDHKGLETLVVKENSIPRIAFGELEFELVNNMSMMDYLPPEYIDVLFYEDEQFTKAIAELDAKIAEIRSKDFSVQTSAGRMSRRSLYPSAMSRRSIAPSRMSSA